MSVQEIFLKDNEFIFETVMRVRNTEVGVGQYLTVESLTEILAEARYRFFFSQEIKEVNSEFQGLMATDIAINLPTQVRAREELLIEVGIRDIDEKKGTLHFKISRMNDGSLVAKASSTVINFDYRQGKRVKFSKSLIEQLDTQPFEI